MSFPGGNILSVALGLIPSQAVGWQRFLGIVTNAAGIDVPTWRAPVTIRGSFQPVSATLMQALGLDMTKNYATFYASQPMQDVDRDKTGDRLTYNGKTWQIISKTEWYPQDGWDGILCVEVTNAV